MHHHQPAPTASPAPALAVLDAFRRAAEAPDRAIRLPDAALTLREGRLPPWFPAPDGSVHPDCWQVDHSYAVRLSSAEVVAPSRADDAAHPFPSGLAGEGVALKLILRGQCRWDGEWSDHEAIAWVREHEGQWEIISQRNLSESAFHRGLREFAVPGPQKIHVGEIDPLIDRARGTTQNSFPGLDGTPINTITATGLKLNVARGVQLTLERNDEGVESVCFVGQGPATVRGTRTKEDSAPAPTPPAKLEERRGRLVWAPELAIEEVESKSSRSRSTTKNRDVPTLVQHPTGYFEVADYLFRTLHRQMHHTPTGGTFRLRDAELSELITTDGKLKQIAILPNGRRSGQQLFLCGKGATALEEVTGTRLSATEWRLVFHLRMNDGSLREAEVLVTPATMRTQNPAVSGRLTGLRSELFGAVAYRALSALYRDEVTRPREQWADLLGAGAGPNSFQVGRSLFHASLERGAALLETVRRVARVAGESGVPNVTLLLRDGVNALAEGAKVAAAFRTLQRAAGETNVGLSVMTLRELLKPLQGLNATLFRELTRAPGSGDTLLKSDRPEEFDHFLRTIRRDLNVALPLPIDHAVPLHQVGDWQSRLKALWEADEGRTAAAMLHTLAGRHSLAWDHRYHVRLLCFTTYLLSHVDRTSPAGIELRMTAETLYPQLANRPLWNLWRLIAEQEVIRAAVGEDKVSTRGRSSAEEVDQDGEGPLNATPFELRRFTSWLARSVGALRASWKGKIDWNVEDVWPVEQTGRYRADAFDGRTATVANSLLSVPTEVRDTVQFRDQRELHATLEHLAAALADRPPSPGLEGILTRYVLGHLLHPRAGGDTNYHGLEKLKTRRQVILLPELIDEIDDAHTTVFNLKRGSVEKKELLRQLRDVEVLLRDERDIAVRTA